MTEEVGSKGCNWDEMQFLQRGALGCPCDFVKIDVADHLLAKDDIFSGSSV